MFEWKPQYTLGIRTIDAQHQRLFVLAQELHAAMAQGKGKAVLEKSLAGLVDYTKVHFAAEEQLMRQYQYQELEQHRREHDALTIQVLAFQSKFASGQLALTVDLLKFLSDWLDKHILGSDQKYGAVLRARLAA